MPFKITIVALLGFLFVALGTPTAVQANGLGCDVPGKYDPTADDVRLQAQYYYGVGRNYTNTFRNNAAAAGCYKRAAEDNFAPYTLSGTEYAIIAIEALNRNLVADVRTYFPKAETAKPPYTQFTGRQYYGAAIAFRSVCRADNYAQDANCQRAERYASTAKKKGYSPTAVTNEGGGNGGETTLENAAIVKLSSWSCQIPETYAMPPSSLSALAEYYYGVGQYYVYQGNFSNAAPCYQQAAEVSVSPKTLSGDEYAIIAVVAMKNNVDGGRNQDIRVYVPKAEQATVPYKNFTGEQYYNTGNAFYTGCILSKDSSGNSGNATEIANCQQAYNYLSIAEIKGFAAANADLAVLRAAFSKKLQQSNNSSLSAAACPEDTPCASNGCDIVWSVNDFSFVGVGVDDSGVYRSNETYVSPRKYYERALYHLKKDVNANSADSATLDENAKKTAILCLKQASSLGYAPAQTELAVLYRRGDAGNIDFSMFRARGSIPNSKTILSENYSIALKLLERAAAQGYAPAYYHLALAHMNGQGVDRDDRLGVSLLKVAAGYIQAPNSAANPFPLKPFQDGYDKYTPLVCEPPISRQAAGCYTPYQEICVYYYNYYNYYNYGESNIEGSVECRFQENIAGRVCNQRAALCAPPSRGDVFNPGFLKQVLPAPLPETALYQTYQPEWRAQQALSNLYSRGKGVAKSCATSQFFWEASVRRRVSENQENNAEDDGLIRLDMIRLYSHSTVADAQGNPVKNRYTLTVQDENGNGTSYNNVVETPVSTSTDGSSIGEYLDAWLPKNNRGCEEAATAGNSNDIGYFDAMYWRKPAR